MDIKKIVGAVVGAGAAIGGAAILFNKNRHSDDFIEADVVDEVYDDHGNVIEEK